MATLDHVLAISLVGSAVMPVRVPTGPVFAHKCAVFALDDFASLAVLSSNAHTTWVVRYTSTMRMDVNYSPSDVFLTLPRPEPTPTLERLGQRLDSERRQLMLRRGWGLTTTYNHVHDPAARDPAVVGLRYLHAEIDEAVLAAYGWDLEALALDLVAGLDQGLIFILGINSMQSGLNLLREWRTFAGVGPSENGRVGDREFDDDPGHHASNPRGVVDYQGSCFLE